METEETVMYELTLPNRAVDTLFALRFSEDAPLEELRSLTRPVLDSLSYMDAKACHDYLLGALPNRAVEIEVEAGDLQTATDAILVYSTTGFPGTNDGEWLVSLIDEQVEGLDLADYAAASERYSAAWD